MTESMSLLEKVIYFGCIGSMLLPMIYLYVLAMVAMARQIRRLFER